MILQISVKDILKGLAENTRSPLFNQSLAQADELQKSSDESYVESFFTAFESLKGDQNLASPSIFANRTLSDDIRIDMTDDEVKPIIRTKIDESIVSAFEVLRKRIDKFGVTQPNIQRLGNSGRILVELPGARDIERVKNLLQSTAQLEFWETESKDKLTSFLFQANELLKQTVVQDSILKNHKTIIQKLMICWLILRHSKTRFLLFKTPFLILLLISIFLDQFLFALPKRIKVLLTVTFSDLK